MKKGLIVFLVLLCFSVAAFSQDSAYLMYADANWTYQYWGEAAENGVVATTAEVTGPGQYTVGLDFTGTETGSASGMAFSAVGILTGETTFPGYFIEINSISVNGSEISFEKGYTSSDDGIVTRMNVFNEWVAELPPDARSFDGDVSDAAAIIVDRELFETVESIEVTFTYHEGTSDLAFLMYADGSWTYQFWGGAPENGVVSTTAAIPGDGSYTVGLDFTQTETGHAEDIAFTAVGITRGEETFPGSFIDITAIRVNGAEIAFEKGYTSSDDGIVTRMNIFNEWVAELPEDARSIDGDVSDANWIMVDRELFASVETVEVDFDFVVGSGGAGAEAVEIDAETALAAEYNAYFGIQTENFIFRNAWHEPTYGLGTPNWDHLTGWDGPDEVDFGGSFTDALINGNGRFTVGVDLGEMGLSEDQSFNMLFVSTDIPSALFDQGYLTISDVETTIDGGTPRAFTFVDTEETYARITVMNTYNNDVGVETIPYTMPSESIEISFTISGLAQDAPVSGGFPIWLIIVIAAVAVVLVVVIVATRIHKPKK